MNHLSQILKDDLNGIIAVPRTIPRRIREDIAEICASELLFGKHYDIRDSRRFIERFGVFYPLFLNLKWNSVWLELRKLAGKSPIAGVQALKILLEKTFDILDGFPHYEPQLKDSIDQSLMDALSIFSGLFEQTQEIWGNQMPERNDQAFPQDLNLDLRSKFEDLLESLKELQDNPGSPMMQDFLNDALRARFELKDFIQAESAALELLDRKEDNSSLSQYAEQFAQEFFSLLETTAGIEEQFTANKKESIDSAESELLELGQEEGGDNVSQGTTPTAQGDEVQPSDNNQSDSQSSEELQNQIMGDLAETIYGIIQELQSSQNSTSELGSPQEGMVTGVLEFTGSPNSNELIQIIIQQQLSPAMEAVLSALQKNLETLEILAQLFPGRQWDYSLKDLHRKYIANLERYAKIAEDSDALKDIVNQLGRIEMEYGSRKIAISPHGKTEMHSITYSSDLNNLLPTEAVKLQNPTLKLKFAADMAEKKLLTYQLRGKYWVGGPPSSRKRGPVVALVDTSESMCGLPETIAKATVLATARRMLKEERDVKVILFSSYNQLETIDLTSKKKMSEEFLEFLCRTFGGGTDFNTALNAGIQSLKEPDFKSADLLFITDGGSTISNRALIEEWNSLKEEQDARIFSLIIGNSSAGGLEQVSDETYIMEGTGIWNSGNSPAHLIQYISR